MMSSSRDRDLDQMDRGSLRATVSRCRDRIEHLELMVLKLRRDHYGPSSERSTASDQQLSLGLIPQERVSDPVEQPSQSAAARPQPASVRKSRALPEHLRREVHTHLPDGKHCPDCGGTLRHLGEDVSEMLEYIPATFIVIRHVRPKFSCSRCCSVGRLQHRRDRLTVVFLVPACSRTSSRPSTQTMSRCIGSLRSSPERVWTWIDPFWRGGSAKPAGSWTR